MLTEGRPDLFGFAPVEGREVVATFDAGAITSDAGALPPPGFPPEARSLPMSAALSGNRYDGHTLAAVIPAMQTLIGYVSITSSQTGDLYRRVCAN